MYSDSSAHVFGFLFLALTDCHSCVTQRYNSTEPSYPSTRRHETCAWCIHDSTCQLQSSMTDTCNSPPAQPIGWWMGGATVAVNQSQCAGVENRPAGLRYAVYKSSIDYSLPDDVSTHVPKCKLKCKIFRHFSK